MEEMLRDIDTDEQSFPLAFALLQTLHDLSRTCQFTEFWHELNAKTEATSGMSAASKLLARTDPEALQETYLSAHPHFTRTIRMLFSTVIASSFSRIHTAQLERWLDLEGSELSTLCTSMGWKIEGDVVVIPANGENDVKAGVIRENVKLSDLTKLIATAAVA